jgi:hypothetical protein
MGRPAKGSFGTFRSRYQYEGQKEEWDRKAAQEGFKHPCDFVRHCFGQVVERISPRQKSHAKIIRLLQDILKQATSIDKKVNWDDYPSNDLKTIISELQKISTL